MTDQLHLDPERRHEFALLFDVRDGNPNGDPDSANLPRVDPETMEGLVTDVSIKRKVRDYILTTRRGEEGLDIFIRPDSALNEKIEEAGEEVGVSAGDTGKRGSSEVKDQLCSEYFDIRTFGAVLTTGEVNAGQVRGPIQLSFGRSIDPVVSMDLSVTRQAATTVEDWEQKGGKTIGRKPVIPYGLYRAHGFFNPYLADGTGLNSDDLEVFWEALENMYEFDRSAARGQMAVRRLWVFSHEDKKGNAHAHELFDLIDVEKRDGVDAPRSFDHYEVDAPGEGRLDEFEKVSLTRLV